ncbi:MAG: sel1 repeat family protein, partial [Nitrosomonadaceae bacterium]|nr:sel1 repeat family protein [Nitrosomonadaceae bacterium]
MKTWILFIATILSLSSSVARAGVFEEGIEAYKNGNYAKALALLHPLASQGMTNAQNNLGWMYEEGKGVTQDYQEAAKWYHLAAEQGDVDAQNNLGVMYVKGTGINQDYILARMWFNLAANNGDINAKENLDKMAKEMKPSQIANAQRMAQDCEKRNYKNC